MILVAGGTGNLGIELVPYLGAQGIPVRVFTRDPDRARQRLGETPQFAQGDARNPQMLGAALEGVEAVVSAITGFGPGAPGPRAVDYEGNLNLIKAAEAAGVPRFVLVSMYGASADHSMELARMKYHAEEALRASRLDWVIVRPNPFMELGPRLSVGRSSRTARPRCSAVATIRSTSTPPRTLLVSSRSRCSIRTSAGRFLSSEAPRPDVQSAGWSDRASGGQEGCGE